MEHAHKTFNPTETIAIVIPCYNVAAHIEQVIEGLPPYISRIIAVDDCSKDDTASLLERLQTRNPKIVCIRHSENRGVGGAMLTGYKKALELQAEIIVKMDGDGQMDARNIAPLVKPLID